MERKTVWLVGFRWLTSGVYEAQLEKLARQGWRLGPLGRWSSLRMTFVQDEPRQVFFGSDFADAPEEEQERHRQEGWQPVGQLNGGTLWQASCAGPRPAWYVDEERNQTQNRKAYRQLRGLRALLAGLLMIILFLLFIMLAFGQGYGWPLLSVLTLVCGLSVGYLQWALGQIRRDITQ